MKRWRTILTVMALLLPLTGCGDETPATSGPGAASTGPEGTLPPDAPTVADPPSGAGVTAAVAVPDDALAAVRRFIAALSEGDAEAAKELFLPREQYERMFRGERLEMYYSSLRQQFDRAVDEHAAALAGGEFARLEPRNEEPATAYPEGASIGDVALAKRATVLRDAKAEVRVQGAARTIRIPYLIETPDGWRIFSTVEFETPRGEAGEER